jgi:hypothetical protein
MEDDETRDEIERILAIELSSTNTLVRATSRLWC